MVTVAAIGSEAGRCRDLSSIARGAAPGGTRSGRERWWLKLWGGACCSTDTVARGGATCGWKYLSTEFRVLLRDDAPKILNISSQGAVDRCVPLVTFRTNVQQSRTRRTAEKLEVWDTDRVPNHIPRHLEPWAAMMPSRTPPRRGGGFALLHSGAARGGSSWRGSRRVCPTCSRRQCYAWASFWRKSRVARYQGCRQRSEPEGRQGARPQKGAARALFRRRAPPRHCLECSSSSRGAMSGQDCQ